MKRSTYALVMTLFAIISIQCTSVDEKVVQASPDTEDVQDTQITQIAQNTQDPQERLESACQGLYEKYGVNVWYDSEDCPVMETLYYHYPTLGIEPIDIADAMEIMYSVDRFLSMHDIGLVKGNLDNIILASSIVIGNKTVKGMFSTQVKNSIIVAFAPEAEFMNKAELIQILTHEFAHLLFSKYWYQFPDKEYVSLMPKDFDASNNLMEELAVLFTWYFTDYEQLLKTMQRYPELLQKIDIITAFYDGLIFGS